MSAWPWIATAWLAAAVSFLFGCMWAGRNTVGTIHALSERIIDLKRANGVLATTVAAQQEYIDYLEGGGDVVAEAENLLREPGT